MALLRLLSALVFAISFTHSARAAAPKDIDAAVQKGLAYLKKSGENGKWGRDSERVGATALVGLALLEAGTPPDDASVKKITAFVRDAAYTQNQTYQVALCLLYLDRLGEPGDRPLIQMLGVRLLAGQNANGGWTYECIPTVPPATERLLRTKLSDTVLIAGRADPAPAKPLAPGAAGKPGAGGKLHADVEKYRQGLLAADHGRAHLPDDNSNTQFGVLGVWVARKHDVPVEHALELIEKRFLAQQGAAGGWPYSGLLGRAEGSPSMTCAGLLGLATAIGRREEKKQKAELVVKTAVKEPKPEPAKPAAPPGADPNDPFYNPPKVPEADAPKKPAAPAAPKANRGPGDPRDAAVKLGMANLAAALAGEGREVRGRRGNDPDLYFLWSLERVGVIYGVDKIGNTDWYDFGADTLVAAQRGDGSWTGRSGYGADVDTAFALLFLSRSNLARDLAAKVQRSPANAELRANAAPAPGDTVAAKPEPPPSPTPAAVEPPIKPVAFAPPSAPKPVPGTTASEIAIELTRTSSADWEATLKRVREAKGQENTGALLAVIPLIDGERKATAREALAERLCRMTPVSLRGMLKADDAELRRAAALACAMKDDKDHVPDLIDALGDKNEVVTKAARAGLKSLTEKDFATANEWREWYASRK
ncbi:hypothetical protein J8F10_28890 [Gemmata sp. G18]|uniref:Squalene cyclase C-terminal domain-containing protein n=1 Tax=Gemmata palustris TaxID=2822762 RepID=A0ABS5C072_9BACT|nr:hypothetical protein [Gemmata palustris]MBP3959280.1 hypothetical protein [Gemmata palustris]